MKLYGEELDKELAKRAKAKKARRAERKTFRDKAKELGMKPSEYLDWENGRNICPHEKYEKSIGGVHKPFLLMETCVKCGNPRIIAKIETEEDCDKYKAELEEALRNAGMLKEEIE